MAGNSDIPRYILLGFQVLILLGTLAMAVFISFFKWIKNRNYKSQMVVILAFSALSQILGILFISFQIGSTTLLWIFEWSFSVYLLLLILLDMEFFKALLALSTFWKRKYVEIMQIIAIIGHFLSFGGSYAALFFSSTGYSNDSLLAKVLTYILK